MSKIICPHCGSEDTRINQAEEISAEYYCNECEKVFVVVQDIDIVEETITQAKKIQRLQDTNRIERKSFRNFTRYENATFDVIGKYTELLQNYNLKVITNDHKIGNSEYSLVVHITDVHFNELIELDHNKSDFRVLSKRFRKLAGMIKDYCLFYGIGEVYLAIGGDLMNSDRRLDEKMAMCALRSQAIFLSVAVLEQFILDLNQVANIRIGYVVGNESRVPQEMTFGDHAAYDNYDFVIMDSLARIFRDKPGIIFDESKQAKQHLFTIGGQNFLLMHGEAIKGGDTIKTITQKFGQMVQGQQVRLDYILYGHVHSTFISDFFARSAAMCGTNPYAEHGLMLTGRASQNMFLLEHGTTTKHKIVVDLQNTDNIEGYNIEEELLKYNGRSISENKSEQKLHPKTIIHQVVV